MNLLHMKYAVEIAKAGSVNKASEILCIAQPNLSRSVKELESDLGIIIFDRSVKGMSLTPEGEEFINHAKRILDRIDEVDKMYRSGHRCKQKLSISVPRATYIASAFSEFTKSLGKHDIEIYYEEAGTHRILKNVMSSESKLGIIRYAENYDKVFKAVLESKGIVCEPLAQFTCLILASKRSSLYGLDRICFSDLASRIEIAHADHFVPSMPDAEVRRAELGVGTGKRIFVCERASQLDILCKNPDAFMWVSPVPEDVLKRYELFQRPCDENSKVYKDVLIYKRDYRLTSLDKKLIASLHEARCKSLK